MSKILRPSVKGSVLFQAALQLSWLGFKPSNTEELAVGDDVAGVIYPGVGGWIIGLEPVKGGE